MKTTIHIFTDVKQINPRILQLPKSKAITRDMYEYVTTNIPDRHGQIRLDISHLYIDQWAHEQGLFIPDFAKVEKSKAGFYLEQTNEMLALRDTVVECSFCHSQYTKQLSTFCLDCLHHYEMSEDKLHLTFLRPVSTCDIELSHRSIHVPHWLIDRYHALQPAIETM
jgi:hypothetical protein